MKVFNDLKTRGVNDILIAQPAGHSAAGKRNNETPEPEPGNAAIPLDFNNIPHKPRPKKDDMR